MVIFAQGCVKVAKIVRFSGQHGDLPLRKHVGATLCGGPDLRNSTLTQPCIFAAIFMNINPVEKLFNLDVDGLVCDFNGYFHRIFDLYDFDRKLQVIINFFDLHRKLQE